jgi:hypothetical protein
MESICVGDLGTESRLDRDLVRMSNENEDKRFDGSLDVADVNKFCQVTPCGRHVFKFVRPFNSHSMGMGKCIYATV